MFSVKQVPSAMVHQTWTRQSAFFSAELLPMDEAICSAVISLEIKTALCVIPFTQSKLHVVKE